MAPETSPPPSLVVLLSGKRKSGKDFVASRLAGACVDLPVALVRLSGPLKKRYALEYGLDYEKLLDSSLYKEVYRKAMIVWGEEKRNKDPGYFCRAAMEEAASTLNVSNGGAVYIVTDARRQSDLDYFRERHPAQLMTVRVRACESTRLARGWVFTAGVDDVESECGLDHVQDWDVVVDNDGVDDATAFTTLLRTFHSKL